MNKMLLAASAALAVLALPAGALAQGKGGGGGGGGGGGMRPSMPAGGSMRPATPPGGSMMSSHANAHAMGPSGTTHAQTDVHASTRAYERTGARVTHTTTSTHTMPHHMTTHHTATHHPRMRRRYGGHSCPPGLEKKSPRCVAPGRR